MSESSQEHPTVLDRPLDGATPKRRRRSERSKTRWAYIFAIAAVAGLSAAFAPSQPTGVTVFDVIYRAAFAIAVTLFAACCRRWAWLVLAGVAAVFAATIWGHLLGAVALGFAVHAAFRTETRDRTTGALIGALSVQALLRTDSIGFFGFTAIIVGLAAAMVVFSGYRMMRRRSRARVRIGLAVLAVFMFAAGVGFGFSTLRAAKPLQAGVKEARLGLKVANQSNQTGAASHWTTAHNAFVQADNIMASPLAKLAYAVPVLAQHARLAAVATRSGSAITQSAARTATVAPYERLRAADGTFDLDEIADMEKPLQQTATAMAAARNDVDATSTSWLLSPFRTRINDYRDQLVAAIPQAEDALQAVQIAPEVLGGNGKRHYLLLFGNPAETRGLGGFIGAWAQLDANDGKLTLARHGKMGDLNNATDPASRKITGEPEYMARYGYLQPARYIQNISASPDFPTVARVAEQLYPQAGGVKVDGVMYIDPAALAALLKLTGPVTADGVPMPLTSKNAASFLMHDQYIDVPGASERSDLLSNAAEATFDALTHRQLPSISKMSEVLAPMMHGLHLMSTVNDAKANDYLKSIGLTGAFPKANGKDLVSIRISNASENKADYFVGVGNEYVVKHNSETGQTTGTLSALLYNSVSNLDQPTYVLGNQDTRSGRTDGRPFGSTTLHVSMYSVLKPTSMTIGGKQVGMQIQREFGMWVASQTVTLAPKVPTTIDLKVEGQLPTNQPYRVVSARQPTAKTPIFALYSYRNGPNGKPVAPVLKHTAVRGSGVSVLTPPKRRSHAHK